MGAAFSRIHAGTFLATSSQLVTVVGIGARRGRRHDRSGGGYCYRRWYHDRHRRIRRRRRRRRHRRVDHRIRRQHRPVVVVVAFPSPAIVLAAELRIAVNCSHTTPSPLGAAFIRICAGTVRATPSPHSPVVDCVGAERGRVCHRLSGRGSGYRLWHWCRLRPWGGIINWECPRLWRRRWCWLRLWGGFICRRRRRSEVWSRVVRKDRYLGTVPELKNDGVKKKIMGRTRGKKDFFRQYTRHRTQGSGTRTDKSAMGPIYGIRKQTWKCIPKTSQELNWRRHQN